MLSDIVHAQILQNTSLDTFLEKGWFRMGQSVFTTNFLHFEGILYSALWLKVDLLNFKLSSSQKEIIRKNKGFKVHTRKYIYTDEKENLYTAYRNSLTFKTSETLHSLLTNGEPHNYFNTYEVAIYDQQKLIALGIFDLGDKAAEGIVSVIDPNYKKHSLGKYLVLKKMEFLKNNNIDIFYPGYFVPDYSQFDYKLDISKNATYFLDLLTDTWKPIEEFNILKTPINIIKSKLNDLSNLLNAYGLVHQVLTYDYFDINMTENFNGYNLLDSPIIIYCYTNKINQEAAFIYDILEVKYKFITCSKDFSITYPTVRDGHYYGYLLKQQKTLVESENAQEIIEEILDKVG